jgi:transglutaminase-like putative cysteine protease
MTGKGAGADSALLTANRDMVDHRGVDWKRVRWTAYVVHQHFRYEYPARIHDLRHRLVIVPPERHGDQRLITHRLEISSPTTEVRREQDAFGNLVLSLAIDQVAQAVEFTAWILVERDAIAGPVAVSAETYAGLTLREPSPLTMPDGALCAAAEGIGDTGGDDSALAARINEWVHCTLRYSHGATGVRTPAAEALALGRGVCQDFAHVMLALCRLRGLVARYVSGHLLGEGGTHAWVEVLLPDPGHPGRYVARPFDPTHGTEPGLNYVTVAVGRDYGDVAPTSGTYRSPVPGHLVARKHVGVTAVEYFGDTT